MRIDVSEEVYRCHAMCGTALVLTCVTVMAIVARAKSLLTDDKELMPECTLAPWNHL